MLSSDASQLGFTCLCEQPICMCADKCDRLCLPVLEGLQICLCGSACAKFGLLFASSSLKCAVCRPVCVCTYRLLCVHVCKYVSRDEATPQGFTLRCQQRDQLGLCLLAPSLCLCVSAPEEFIVLVFPCRNQSPFLICHHHKKCCATFRSLWTRQQ